MTIAEFPLTSQTGKQYRIEYNEEGETLRVYESGAIYNEDKKHLIAGMSDNRITTENTDEFRQRKHDKMQEFADRGIIQAIEEHPDLLGDVDIFTARQFLAYQNAKTAASGGERSVSAYKEAKKDMGVDVNPLNKMREAAASAIGRQLVDSLTPEDAYKLLQLLENAPVEGGNGQIVKDDACDNYTYTHQEDEGTEPGERNSDV